MAEARTQTEGFAPRLMLFVSGESAERFPKAINAGASAVCIDLEDAVRPKRKEDAHGQILKWLGEREPSPAGSTPAISLRLNGVRTVTLLRDIVALIDSVDHADFVLLPKVEDASDIQCRRPGSAPSSVASSRWSRRLWGWRVPLRSRVPAENSRR